MKSEQEIQQQISNLEEEINDYKRYLQRECCKQTLEVSSGEICTTVENIERTRARVRTLQWVLYEESTKRKKKS